MFRIREAIVVEGRYDKNALSQVVDTLILETSGFGIFRNPEQMALLRRAAQRRGLVVLTDSDGAGFVIRNRIRGAVPPEQVKHAYIPDRYGKERRKRRAGREGKLGVEGMPPQVLEQALRRAGVTVLEEDGSYLGSVSEGDFLWHIVEQNGKCGMKAQESGLIRDLVRPGWNPPVRVDASLDALLQSALVQNFIPVVDDRGAFIGIVTRKDILQWAITRAGCPKSALS